MRKMLSAAAAFATAATAVVAMSGAAQAAPADDSWDGCPYGAVCIYGQGVEPTDNPHPTNVYYSYGAHNLSNQFGNHWVYNNQYGGASMSLCKGYNGTNCGTPIPEGYAVYADLGPINSITLNRP
ncbi:MULTISPECIES: hypothetical protein [unclassified Streptomyces]|uniref:hypothetical protein n=1 Tax=unclassified Streptomyces TaxID=2593676 RepID=UPI001152AA70|nr:hypothetical protein [Streptomyces sp. SLBN-31]TQJ92267.1 hypothetical protein FBY22_3123 [Streptomyces sp. SLBN-31]